MAALNETTHPARPPQHPRKHITKHGRHVGGLCTRRDAARRQGRAAAAGYTAATGGRVRASRPSSQCPLVGIPEVGCGLGGGPGVEHPIVFVAREKDRCARGFAVHLGGQVEQ